MTEPAARPTFRRAGLLRAGYAPDDVDAFVDRLFTAVATGAPVPDILGERFATRRGGYDMEEVDQFLDEVAAGLGGTEPTEQERSQEQMLREVMQDLRDKHGL